MKYIYGPVKSRRLGNSLGVSLTPYKVCSFDCIYCQLGETTVSTEKREEYVPLQAILTECAAWLKLHADEASRLDYISFSGFGEPTLHSGMAQLVVELRKMTNVPLALITNSSLLIDEALRKEALAFDLVVPSLDAATQEVFERIDRPHPGIRIEDIIEALVKFRAEFKGHLWLEIMLISRVNDDLRHIRKLKEAVQRIRPDKIQLNSPVRTPAEANLKALSQSKLKKIKEIFGPECEIF